MKLSRLQSLPLLQSFLLLGTGLLVVFAGLLGGVTWLLRIEMHRELQERDAEALYELALLQVMQLERESIPLPDPYGSEMLLVEAALITAERRGILGIRLFSPAGERVEEIPIDFDPGMVDELFDSAAIGERATRFHPRGDLAAFFPDRGPSHPVPLLEVAIPFLRQGGDPRLIGVAHYLLDGSDLAEAFRAVDHRLLQQSATVFTGGAFLVFGMLVFFFRRLHRATHLLRERTRQLVTANAELTLAAKTDAIGSITAHLLHGLRSPLSGLKLFVENSRIGTKPLNAEQWEAVAESTRHMHRIIHDVVEVLRADAAGQQYEITLEEFQDCVRQKAEPIAEGAGVHFLAGDAPEGTLDGRRANLLLLILFNLIQNSIDVTPRAMAVTFQMMILDGMLRIDVSDAGPGIPKERRENLFAPGKSTKPEGSGLGLSISHQLALRIGAELVLLHSDENGSCFSVRLPLHTKPDTPVHSLVNGAPPASQE